VIALQYTAEYKRLSMQQDADIVEARQVFASKLKPYEGIRDEEFAQAKKLLNKGFVTKGNELRENAKQSFLEARNTLKRDYPILEKTPIEIPLSSWITIIGFALLEGFFSLWVETLGIWIGRMFLHEETPIKEIPKKETTRAKPSISPEETLVLETLKGVSIKFSDWGKHTRTTIQIRNALIEKNLLVVTTKDGSKAKWVSNPRWESPSAPTLKVV
jgi:hypothetical protein